MSQWLASTPIPRLSPAPDARPREQRSPSSSIRDLETSFRIPRRGSIAFSRRSCSTISSRTKKGRHCRAVRRVLKPGGEFYMLDFEGPEDGAHGFLARLLHSSDRMKDNSESRVLSVMRQAGFADPKKVGRRRMLLGGVAYYRAGRSWQGVSA